MQKHKRSRQTQKKRGKTSRRLKQIAQKIIQNPLLIFLVLSIIGIGDKRLSCKMRNLIRTKA